MPMRLSELHPSTVHFPIALVPLAVGADAVGYFTGSRRAREMGETCIVGAVIAAAVAGVFGLVAQEEVELDDAGYDVLKTHRTLNLGALVALGTMAYLRVRRKKPSLGYVLAGIGMVGLVAVSAYLGGKLVYDHGAGVAKTRGLHGRDPQLRIADALAVTARAAKDIGRGVVHAAKDTAKGDILPAFGARAE